MKKLSFLCMVVILLLLVSCQKDRFGESSADISVLQFTYTDVSWPIEKGSDYNLDTQGQTISVFGYTTSDTWANSIVAATPNLFHRQEVTRQSDGTWSYTPPKYWRFYDKHHFFAFAPYASAYSVSANTETGTPSITYRVPAGAVDQKDLLWSLEPASPTATQQLLNRPANSGNIDFVFGHALTKISFKALVGASIDVDRYRISSVTIQDVFYEGTTKFTPKADNYAAPDAYTGATWIKPALDKRQDFIAGGAALSNIFLTNTAQLITFTNGYFYMMPQKIEGTTEGNDPKIIVTVHDKNNPATDKVLATNLTTPSGNGWKSGQHIEYTITYNGGGNDAMTLKATVTQWNGQDIPVSLQGTYLSVVKSAESVSAGGSLRLYYSTDGVPVSCSFANGTVTHVSAQNYFEITNITATGTATVTAGKLKKEITITVN